ncbi:MAG: hypothetical protein AAF211_21180 [Myxococcota bacterium]
MARSLWPAELERAVEAVEAGEDAFDAGRGAGGDSALSTRRARLGGARPSGRAWLLGLGALLVAGLGALGVRVGRPSEA